MTNPLPHNLPATPPATPRLFDVYIAVDWSARSGRSPAAPTEDAIWVAELDANGHGDAARSGETYWRTRASCREHLRERLRHHVARNRRVFIGFDFAYGYPAGLAEALGLVDKTPPWWRLWEALSTAIIDDADNRNNRFAVASALNARCGGPAPGPFWGCPANQATDHLEMRTPAGGYPYPVREGLALRERRWTEQRAAGAQPVWKLAYTGSVGSQCLLGIPVVRSLVADPALGGVSRVWPFETGFTERPTPERGPFVLHVEIWPGVVRSAVDPSVLPKDRAQVRAVVEWLHRLDRAGTLGRCFDTPPGLAPAAVADCINEEGWLLGAGER